MHTPSRSAVWCDLATLLNPADVLTSGKTDSAARNWLAIFRLSTAHLVAPTLYATLAASGALDQTPQDIREALAALHHLNAARNRRLRVVLRDTAYILNQAGIEPLLLKGANALLPGQYPHAFARMLGDLDLGVAETEAIPAAETLLAAGFYYAPNIDIDPADYSTNHHHLVPLFHPAGDGYVELHRELLSDRVPKAVLSLPMVRASAQQLDWEGVRVGIPTLEHRLLHNALHHLLADQAFCSGRLSLRQLLEFAQLRALPHAAALDWLGLFQHLDATGVGDVVRSYLLLAQRLFGQPLPAGVHPTAAALRAEARFWFRLNHPRLSQIRVFARRLCNLPKRLTTPAWYPAKYRYYLQQWQERRRLAELLNHLNDASHD